MTIDDEELPDALMVQVGNNVGEDSLLRFLTEVHTERQVTLSWILRTHIHRRQHHAANALLLHHFLCRIYRHVVGENAVGEVRKMEVMRLRGTPRQDGDIIVLATRCAIDRDA